MTATTIIFTTNHGDIHIELDFDKAPISAENFKKYALDGFFKDTLFHRVIPGFVIQGGGFDTSFIQKTTQETIQNESDNGLKNLRGSLSMARTNDPHSATSQFFINLTDNASLDHGHSWGYAVFGKVTQGMDVVDLIAQQPTTQRGMHSDVPTEDIIVSKVTVA